MVSGIGSYDSSRVDLRAKAADADIRGKAADAAVQGRLGLAAAEAYLQSSVPAAGNTARPARPSARPDQTAFQPDARNDTDQGRQTSGDSVQTFIRQGAGFEQMLAAQEADTHQASPSPTLAGRAVGAYAATMALTADPDDSNSGMDILGWNDRNSAGGGINLMP